MLRQMGKGWWKEYSIGLWQDIYLRFFKVSYSIKPLHIAVVSVTAKVQVSNICKNVKFQIHWVMLWALPSNWNYSFYWGRFRKSILFMISAGYCISYKIVKNACNIIRCSLGTPGVGQQECKRFLKGHLTTVAFLLSPRRSYFKIITSPFALRPW